MAGPFTLSIDIGGSHLKAGVLDATGVMTADRVRIPTPKPAAPDAVVQALLGMAASLPRFDRISIGFPGVVRQGVVLTAPNLGTPAWHGMPLADTLAARLGRPARMLNDASVQGLGVITRHGVECVITLGTGMGFALFLNGRLGPHLEVGQHPVKTDKTYDQYVGEAALQRVGRQHWNRRVRKVITTLHTLTTFETLCIGGGNAREVETPLPEHVRVVANAAGITGGVRLWDSLMDGHFAAPLPGSSPA